MSAIARRAAIIAAAAFGLALIGAADNPFARIGKADRVAEGADCAATSCPTPAAAEVIDVAPGLTVVERIPG
jgi:hypothetical protein